MNSGTAQRRFFWVQRILLILSAFVLVNCGEEGNLLKMTSNRFSGTIDGDTGDDSDGDTGDDSDGDTGDDSGGDTCDDTDADTDNDTGGDTVGDADGDTGGDVNIAPLDILTRYAPADEDAAKNFHNYLTEELGVLITRTKGTGTTRTITQTIFVPPNTTYDGKGEVLTADADAFLCEPSDTETDGAQRPIFLLAPGAGVKNVTITSPGCEGIHMLGNNVLDNITWEDAGEDAASVRSYFPGGSITIKNSEAYHADQMFQFNAPCNVRIENFSGDDMSKFVRGNGHPDMPLNVDLNTVTVTNVFSAVVQSDSPLCKVRYHDLTYVFATSGDMSDQVFRDILSENVTNY